MTQTSIRTVSGGGGNNESLIPPGRSGYIADGAHGQKIGDNAEDYWFALIGEKAAGAFLGLKDRTMQNYRYRGGGPKYIFLSSRCLRYRRIDLREWADARLRTSTSDPGKGAA